MHYMLVTSITVPLQAASNERNYMHYMAHYMLSKMLMAQVHGVSLSEPRANLKMSTNLKCILKLSVQMYTQMRHLRVHCSRYTL